jgi:hypothetical protein
MARTSLSVASDTAAGAAEVQASIERMRRRVHATIVHEPALERTAEGVRWIHAQLASLLRRRVAQLGWSEDNRLAQSALDAMDEQLRAVGPEAGRVPVEKLRLSLDHALFRATDALVLMWEEPD